MGLYWNEAPWIDVPNWYLAPAWSGVAALVFAALAVAAWLAPRARPWRRMATPVMAALAALGVASSFTTLAYTDTFNDPLSITRPSRLRVDKRSSRRTASPATATAAMEMGRWPRPEGPAADLTAPHVGNHTIGDIFHWISYGGTSGVMPGFKDSLDTDDRWDVINYLLMLSYTIRARDTLRPQPPIMQWLIARTFSSSIRRTRSRPSSGCAALRPSFPLRAAMRAGSTRRRWSPARTRA